MGGIDQDDRQAGLQPNLPFFFPFLARHRGVDVALYLNQIVDCAPRQSTI
jgi:hypothetical protein